MKNILLLNKIAKIGLSVLDTENYACSDSVANPDAIMVRSAAMHDMEIPESVLAIARAGAGVNNIPLDKCTEAGIAVFNTPGANANAVKELVIAGLLLSSRKIAQGIDWTKTLAGKDDAAKLVEKGKSQFVGPEIEGKTLGIIGLGAIGILVANVAIKLGMEVIGFDPYISVDGAWGLSRAVKHAKTLDEIYAVSDYITVHVPLNDSTKNTISKESIAKMKDGVRILNFARGGLVNSEDIKAALESGKVSCYVTDFPDASVIGVENIIAIPHLGASTPESEDNCAVMAAKELKAYIENGNVINSVNFPCVSEPRTTDVRICVLHKNVPNMINHISAILGDKNINIEHFSNKSRGDIAYSIIDVAGTAPDDTEDVISAIDGVIKVRIIK
ncbi:MAG: phosphoglycerate dehydrogenase [Clostridia bacterium]|nr:phosphoglycerate dehydrogenase [Clostridia bacterium]